MFISKIFKTIKFILKFLSTILDKILSLAINNGSKSANSKKLNTFEYSGESSLIEDYKCFDDKSNLDFIDGREILDNPSWSENTKKLWYYFYRPYNYGYNIGGNQRRRIRDMEIAIIEKTNQLKIFRITIIVLTLISFFAIYNAYANNDYSVSSSIFLLLACFMVIVYFIFAHGVTEDELSSFKEGIRELNYEVAFLVEQQKNILYNRLSSNDIEKMFWNDMVSLEKYFIETILNEDFYSVKEKTRKYYDNKVANDVFLKNKIDLPVFPLVPSWGMLQQSYIGGINNSRRTGLYTFHRKIGDKIATWRNTSSGKSFYRICYIQFLFFEERNLRVISLYYDFITKEKFDVRNEGFPYNHISHYSYNEEDLSYMMTDPLIENLNIPENLIQNIYEKQTKAISFSFSSGSSYKCVLPDKDVSNGLSDWLKYKEKVSYKIENQGFLTQEDKKEMLNSEVEQDDVIFTLAKATFEEIGRRVKNFSIMDKDNTYDEF
ncbi:hypothetical protein HMY34_10305 [Thiothrix subterranea]|uniref:hypothetical protein n=1 Tax=Thiothrix subterranea TaxID=2735563 RepID=UPI00192CE46B|nr:hypothetical protein [Thiothrix subterranea]QQZ29124.1 hypothetical protein HMY34_10305 [Thiothrix subterranea]